MKKKALTAENSTMIERLQTSRWGQLRWDMYHMKVGETTEMDGKQDVTSTRQRMNNAFQGEMEWKSSKLGSIFIVTRIK